MVYGHHFERWENRNMSATNLLILTKFGPHQPRKIEDCKFRRWQTVAELNIEKIAVIVIDKLLFFGRPYYWSSLWHDVSSVCLSVCLSVTFCIVAKRCVLAKNCLKE